MSRQRISERDIFFIFQEDVLIFYLFETIVRVPCLLQSSLYIIYYIIHQIYPKKHLDKI